MDSSMGSLSWMDERPTKWGRVGACNMEISDSEPEKDKSVDRASGTKSRAQQLATTWSTTARIELAGCCKIEEADNVIEH